ncbi:MAG: spore germination protein [Clostridia bacterium]|nr:spore germination protein [Clostridia bacterium]
MTALHTRQICFILTAYSMAGKLLMLPAQLAYFAGNDLWISALISYALQTIAVFAASFLCSKTDKTVFALIKDTFGGTVSKIFMWLFAIFFLLAAFLPVYEQKLFVHEIFYDTVPALIVFIPFFFVAAYVGGKGINNAGRTADIMFFLFAAAFAVIFIMSATEANFSWLLPVSGGSVKGVLKGVVSTLYNFTDGAVMLMFVGRFRYKKGDCLKITLSYAVGAIVIILYLLVFYSVFSTLSPDEYFSIAKSAIFFPALSVTGRVDLIGVYVIEVAMLLALIMYIQLCVQCLNEALSDKVKPMYLSFIINGILLIALIALNDKYKALHGVYGGILWYVFAIFAVLLPCLSWILKRKREGGE